MKLWSESFKDGAPIPAEFAFCKPADEGHVTFSDNMSPHLAWRDVPAGARSLALVCHDPDVPSVGDDVNQDGKTVPATLPRVDFFHWILVDVPVSKTGFAAGELSHGVTAGGKPGPTADHGMRQGTNNYTQWFAGAEGMDGIYFGYDGPAPPWNDSIVHHYHFTLYALDLPRLPLEGEFDGPAVLAAMAGHVLAQAAWVGTYSLNPDVPA